MEVHLVIGATLDTAQIIHDKQATSGMLRFLYWEGIENAAFSDLLSTILQLLPVSKVMARFLYSATVYESTVFFTKGRPFEMVIRVP